MELAVRRGRTITLIDLAAHASALPLVPDESAKEEGAARISGYQRALGSARGTGTGSDYSNIGSWLLGPALSTPAGTDFDTLLRDRVLAGYELTRTAFTAPPRERRELCHWPRHITIQPAPYRFDVPVLQRSAAEQRASFQPLTISCGSRANHGL